MLALAAALLLFLRTTDRDVRQQAAEDRAEARAAVVASSTARSLDATIGKAQVTADLLLGGNVTPRALELAVPLADAQIAAVFDADTEEILGIGIPGQSSDFATEVDLDVVRQFFPDSTLGLDGRPDVAAGGLGDIGTLVTLFVPFEAGDGGQRVLATGVLFDQSVLAPTLAAAGADAFVQIVDADGHAIFSARTAPTNPSIQDRVSIPGTTWAVEVMATGDQLGAPTGLLWDLRVMLLLAVLVCALIGIPATRVVLAAHQVEGAYAQTAWVARQQREFTALVAHELRTPATSLGLARYLADQWHGIDDAQRRDLVERVASSADHLARLVDDLRLSNGFDSGPVTLSPREIAVADLLARGVGRSAVAAGDLTLTGAVESKVVVDPRFAERALASVLDNAAQHGSAPIEVDVQPVARGVQIRVHDHGEGIPEAFVPFLFEPFTQARSHMRRDHRGTGLGLHLVSAILEQMGGTIVHEPTDEGACFVLSLPGLADDGVSPSRAPASLSQTP